MFYVNVSDLRGLLLLNPPDCGMFGGFLGVRVSSGKDSPDVFIGWLALLSLRDRELNVATPHILDLWGPEVALWALQASKREDKAGHLRLFAAWLDEAKAAELACEPDSTLFSEIGTMLRGAGDGAAQRFRKFLADGGWREDDG